MWSVNDVSTVVFTPPSLLLLLAMLLGNVCVCVYISVITLVKVQSVNWTVNITGVIANYHKV